MWNRWSKRSKIQKYKIRNSWAQRKFAKYNLWLRMSTFFGFHPHVSFMSPSNFSTLLELPSGVNKPGVLENPPWMEVSRSENHWFLWSIFQQRHVWLPEGCQDPLPGSQLLRGKDLVEVRLVWEAARNPCRLQQLAPKPSCLACKNACAYVYYVYIYIALHCIAVH